MHGQLKNYIKVLFVLSALILSQCGKKSKSSDVFITAAPSQPIVFLTDVPVTNRAGTVNTIKNPWFSFTVQVDNESDTPVVLLALHIEVTGVDSTGTPQVVKTDVLPATDNYTLLNISCIYNDFGEFEAKGAAGNSGSLAETASSPGCGSGTVTFYAGANPVPAQTSFVRYSVKIQPEGYFGTRGNPTDRFDGFSTIYTQ